MAKFTSIKHAQTYLADARISNNLIDTIHYHENNYVSGYYYFTPLFIFNASIIIWKKSQQERFAE